MAFLPSLKSTNCTLSIINDLTLDFINLSDLENFTLSQYYIKKARSATKINSSIKRVRSTIITIQAQLRNYNKKQITRSIKIITITVNF